MTRAITILFLLMILGGCTMTEVSTDQEEMTEESVNQNSPAKGIVIIPNPGKK